MSKITRWTIKHYSKTSGNPINTVDYASNNDEVIRNYTNASIHYIINDFEQASFTLYLDDPVASSIHELTSVIKFWRTVYNDDGSVYYADTNPCFGGTVGYIAQDGESNTMNVQVYNPLWNLKFRFHILNHYLKTNPATASDYTQSELMWKLIDLINNAFGASSYTGIAQGAFLWNSSEIKMAPYFVAKGTNTWSNIFDSILVRAESPEIIPDYVHTNGNTTIMNFKTDQYRGLDKRAYTSFDYRTGNKNLINLSKEIIISPGEFSNYHWEIGQGGPNSGKVAVVPNINSDSYGYQNVTLYMSQNQNNDVKDIGVPDSGGRNILERIADGNFTKIRAPKTAYTATLAPGADTVFGYNFGVGDAIKLNANKGALVVSNVDQRIYEVTLSLSDNNLETAECVIADDIDSKIF